MLRTSHGNIIGNSQAEFVALSSRILKYMSTRPLDFKLIPQWTKRVKTEMGGRDPLGLSRVSQLITDALLPGIITTTERARYYSFYSWAIWHTHQENPKRYQDFIDGMRRREAVMALATVHNNVETSLAGIEATKSCMRTSADKDNYICDFRVLPSNSLGGYGQYYSGSMSNLGLVMVSEDAIDRVTEDKGELLARLYHKTISGTPYIQKKLYGRPRISKDVLDDSCRFLNLDALTETFARSERSALINLMFSRKEHPTGRNLLRRQTLMLILNTIALCQKKSLAICVSERSSLVDRPLVFQPYYYETLKGEGKKTFPYEYPRGLSDCLSTWRQFCLHQYLIQALESLLYCVLELIGAEVQGIPFGKVVDRLITREYLQQLRIITGTTCDTPKKLMKALRLESVPDRASCLKWRKEVGLRHPLNEEALLPTDFDSLPKLAAEATALLAVLYAKWRSATDDRGYREIAEHAGAELWAGSFLPEMDAWFEEADWKKAMEGVIHVHIVRQHDLIMFEKRRLDSCWLHQYEGRYVKDQDYKPAWRSSRHRNAVSILTDLGLLYVNTEGIVTITREGRQLLSEATD